jgi:hypothetical protein
VGCTGHGSLAKVALGEDPQGEKQAKRLGAARTLRAVIDDYLAMKQATLRPSSLRGARLYLLGGYFKPLHASAITDITRGDVALRYSPTHAQKPWGSPPSPPALLHLANILATTVIYTELALSTRA